MRQIACARCGRRVPVKCGVMPRRCTCGEEFEWAPLDGPGSFFKIPSSCTLWP